MDHGQATANNKLCDLHGGQRLFHWFRNPDLEGAQGIISIHQQVDERVEHHEDPDRRSGIADSGPHQKHGTRMVVALKQGRWSALEKNDDGVPNFIELGQVEKVAVESKASSESRAENPIIEVTNSVPEKVSVHGLIGRVGHDRVFGLKHIGKHRVVSLGGYPDGQSHADKSPDAIDTKKKVMKEDQHFECLSGCEFDRNRRKSFKSLFIRSIEFQALSFGTGHLFSTDRGVSQVDQDEIAKCHRNHKIWT